MPTFTPPPSTPAVVEIAPPRYGAQPVSIESHGYRYTVTGNTLLPPRLIEKVLAAAATPKAALGALQDAYHRRGYTLIAITGQIDGDAVHVAVFEGTITQLRTPYGLGWFFPGLEGRNDLIGNELVKDQILAGAYAQRSGQEVNVNVSPAPNPGGTAIDVVQSPLADYQPVTGTLTAGNYGSRFSSAWQAGGDLAANLTHGVQLTANYVQGLPWLKSDTIGSAYYQGGLGASVVTPYGIYGFTAEGIHFRLGNVTAPLFPTGTILTYQLNGTQLLYADTATRLSATESLNRTSFTETVLNGTFTLVRQPYNWVAFGGTLSHALTLGGQPGNVTATATMNIGVSGPVGTLMDGVPGAPTSHFRYANASVSYQQHLPRGFQLDVTGQAQGSFDTLPVESQWTLGGLGNLSAWEPGVAIGDSGYAGRVELSAPSIERLHSSARLGLFLEAGGATFRTPAAGTAPWQTLSDAGVSLRATLPYQFTATAMAALPVEHAGFNAVGENNLRQNRLDVFFVIQKRF